MASVKGLAEGLFALSADAAIFFAFCFAAIGAAVAGYGLYMLKVGSKANALRLLAMSVTAFIGAWLIYGKYQELVIQANGVATGPIYEAVGLIVLLCMPFALVLSLIFYSPSKTPKL
ncbi:hypothetical protein [Pseudomonas corrugata]|uniref:hypothetical protein n=1 Tax=Pseudomonas corrugata TaxID=47879 RepID=UPI0006D8BEB6|nr:hypothetical protein [Pseudomonas corrugata]